MLLVLGCGENPWICLDDSESRVSAWEKVDDRKSPLYMLSLAQSRKLSKVKGCPRSKAMWSSPRVHVWSESLLQRRWRCLKNWDKSAQRRRSPCKLYTAKVSLSCDSWTTCQSWVLQCSVGVSINMDSISLRSRSNIKSETYPPMKALAVAISEQQ